MKNFGSTASKSLAELVEASDSISIDGATTSVVQQNDKPSCTSALQLTIPVLENNSSVEHREAGVKRGPPYGQAVLYSLNARITHTADIRRNQQQERRNTSSSSSLDLSLSLCFPGTKGERKMGNEGISVESQRKRKGTVGALANGSVSALKARRLMQMGKFLEKPFTSCEIIDLESPSFSTHGSTRILATTNANYGQEFVTTLETGNTKGPFPFSENAGPMSRKYAKATSESSSPPGDMQKGPDQKSVTGANSQVRNVLDVAARHMGRPLNHIDQVCLTNRNPADFSEACDPKNFYVR